jgi:hypothetical protein
MPFWDLSALLNLSKRPIERGQVDVIAAGPSGAAEAGLRRSLPQWPALY